MERGLKVFKECLAETSKLIRFSVIRGSSAIPLCDCSTRPPLCTFNTLDIEKHFRISNGRCQRSAKYGCQFSFYNTNIGLFIFYQAETSWVA